jgi:2-oxoglutarate ferredoxin oxidoreductase subunit alpha
MVNRASAGLGTRQRLLSGNHACALGAIAAGCRFFAGYPITPSSEIAERMARELPKAGGVFIQMEDEIASIAAVIGASMGGVKAMTATSGPGFSLKQENLGYAAAAEIPCVIVDVMRGGPSTGMPTRPAQGDIMQARWGSHGDYPVVVLAPASVREIYQQAIRAFDIAEACRVPVILLYDQTVAQLMETVELSAPAAETRAERKWASGPADAFQPYAAGEDGVPAMPRPGSGYRCHTTGLIHAESGFPTQNPEAVERNLGRLLTKLDRHRETIDAWESVACEDADVLVVAIGISARAAARAVAGCRRQGMRAGLFRPITLWPFPEQPLQRAAANAHTVLVPELNAGQLRLEVERILGGDVAVAGLSRIDGNPIDPADIAQCVVALEQPHAPATRVRSNPLSPRVRGLG